jgi:hypothetical protein
MTLTNTKNTRYCKLSAGHLFCKYEAVNSCWRLNLPINYLLGKKTRLLLKYVAFTRQLSPNWTKVAVALN